MNWRLTGWLGAKLARSTPDPTNQTAPVPDDPARPSLPSHTVKKSMPQAANKSAPAITKQPAIFSGTAFTPAQQERAKQAHPPSRTLFTLDGVRRAWLDIKQAGGGAGVDGETLTQFSAALEANLAELYQALASGRYQPKPVRQVLVPKEKGGLRPLALWALRDRIAQRAVYELLLPQLEPIFLPCSFGFRPQRRVEDAVQQVVRHRNTNYRWVVDADIQRCFDEIDSDRLLHLLRARVREPLLVRYVAASLHADILNSVDGMPRKAGASQGNVLSPLLANLYLHEFDQTLTRQNLALVRYADDFVICCRRKEEAQRAQDQAVQALAGLKLQVRPDKTQIVHFDQGFAWLGYFFIRNECYRM
jgi:RNA-directed DNA polymerase